MSFAAVRRAKRASLQPLVLVLTGVRGPQRFREAFLRLQRRIPGFSRHKVAHTLLQSRHAFAKGASGHGDQWRRIDATSIDE
eukprot:scaffold682_cov363-Pavlova_lutheri.AAC.26